MKRGIIPKPEARAKPVSTLSQAFFQSRNARPRGAPSTSEFGNPSGTWGVAADRARTKQELLLTGAFWGQAESEAWGATPGDVEAVSGLVRVR